MTSSEARRSGLLGGTFDPPHAAHLALAEAARATLNLDRVLFVPAGDPWRKAARDVTPAAARLEMTRALVEGIPWIQVSPIEVERDGPSYTADTIEVLSRQGGDWWVILGADALADLEHWHDPARIVAYARLAVAARSGTLIEASPALRAIITNVLASIDRIQMREVDLSSTEARRRLRANERVDDLVPERVLEVIYGLGLYG